MKALEFLGFFAQPLFHGRGIGNVAQGDFERDLHGETPSFV
jgi:hypothetical protein